MSSDLLAIARSGTRAARAALDVTAQNIANASTEGYVRRTADLSEVSASGSIGGMGSTTLAGVRVSGISRNADVFRQIEVRRTGADAARAGSEVQGLENIEAAVEQSGVYQASVAFEGSLQQLVSDPTDGSLRASVIESGRTLASTLNVTASSLDAAGKGMRFEAQGGVDQINLLTGELARVNARLGRSTQDSAAQSTLLDQRDSLLQKLSGQVDITTTFAADKTVEVRIGGATGPVLLGGQTPATLAMTTATNGTIAFTLDGAAVTPAAGALAGKSQALVQLADTRGKLDTIAAGIISAVNGAQASGVDLQGAPGAALFSGTDAGDIAIAKKDGKEIDGSKIATAPAGAEAKSRDPGNLGVLRSALGAANPSGGLDALLFDVSSAVAGRTVTRDALASIADSASQALSTQAGVDLDQEAVNLIRFQQSFSASGRVIQVANDLFDTILAIR
jgi:flagellar hook-associated protein 1 FlgK